MNLYAETSAVLAWLLGEPIATRVRETLDRADAIVSSVLTITEIQRAFVRAEVGKQFRQEPLLHARERLRWAVARWHLMEITAEVRSRAEQRFPVEPLRTLDSIHLATCLEFSKVFARLQVLSLDRRIQDNLPPLGLRSAL